ncbi:hypothetical protein ZEAMMB73_Zm00001d050770 [Zea mays]|uniref:Uncharacterized protein n=1 Tax=Zea mays TaxID=4577 RepID=A0A1D6Q398_MAIZE|nr:hypothetical protein ZEAMMB73_Zm00001d050770 [Zea mays]
MPPPTLEFAQLQSLPAMPSAPPARMMSSTSSKVPKGRLLGTGERAVHDVDSRLPREGQPPQLETDRCEPVVYGLKLGNIRVLNINTTLRSLLRGHTQGGSIHLTGRSAHSPPSTPSMEARSPNTRSSQRRSNPIQSTANNGVQRQRRGDDVRDTALLEPSKQPKSATLSVKVSLAQMLRGMIIMDVVTLDQARIADSKYTALRAFDFYAYIKYNDKSCNVPVFAQMMTISLASLSNMAFIPSYLNICEDGIPHWMMRQAGQYMAEYQASAKGKLTFGHQVRGAPSCEVLRWDFDLKVQGDAYGVDVRHRDNKTGQHVGTGSEP